MQVRLAFEQDRFARTRTLIERSPFAWALSAEDVCGLVEASVTAAYDAGTTIFSEADVASLDRFYLVAEGQATELRGDAKHRREVAEYASGDSFCEWALYSDPEVAVEELRSNPVVVAGPAGCTCVCIDRVALNLLLGNYEELVADTQSHTSANHGSDHRGQHYHQLARNGGMRPPRNVTHGRHRRRSSPEALDGFPDSSGRTSPRRRHWDPAAGRAGSDSGSVSPRRRAGGGPDDSRNSPRRKAREAVVPELPPPRKHFDDGERRRQRQTAAAAAAAAAAPAAEGGLRTAGSLDTEGMYALPPISESVFGSVMSHAGTSGDQPWDGAGEALVKPEGGSSMADISGEWDTREGIDVLGTLISVAGRGKANSSGVNQEATLENMDQSPTSVEHRAGSGVGSVGTVRAAVPVTKAAEDIEVKTEGPRAEEAIEKSAGGEALAGLSDGSCMAVDEDWADAGAVGPLPGKGVVTETAAEREEATFVDWEAEVRGEEEVGEEIVEEKDKVPHANSEIEVASVGPPEVQGADFHGAIAEVATRNENITEEAGDVDKALDWQETAAQDEEEVMGSSPSVAMEAHSTADIALDEMAVMDQTMGCLDIEGNADNLTGGIREGCIDQPVLDVQDGLMPDHLVVPAMGFSGGLGPGAGRYAFYTGAPGTPGELPKTPGGTVLLTTQGRGTATSFQSPSVTPSQSRLGSRDGLHFDRRARSTASHALTSADEFSVPSAARRRGSDDDLSDEGYADRAGRAVSRGADSVSPTSPTAVPKIRLRRTDSNSGGGSSGVGLRPKSMIAGTSSRNFAFPRIRDASYGHEGVEGAGQTVLKSTFGTIAGRGRSTTSLGLSAPVGPGPGAYDVGRRRDLGCVRMGMADRRSVWDDARRAAARIPGPGQYDSDVGSIQMRVARRLDGPEPRRQYLAQRTELQARFSLARTGDGGLRGVGAGMTWLEDTVVRCIEKHGGQHYTELPQQTELCYELRGVDAVRRAYQEHGVDL